MKKYNISTGNFSKEQEGFIALGFLHLSLGKQKDEACFYLLSPCPFILKA